MYRIRILTGVLIIVALWLGALGDTPALSGDDLPTVAVVGFANISGTFIRQIEPVSQEVLSTLLVQVEHFDVVERARVNALVEEIGFTYSGLVDQERTALEIGRLLGADIIALGSILDYNTETVRYTGYGVSTITTIYSMQISVKFVDVNTGRVIHADLAEDSLRSVEMTGLRVTLQNVERQLVTRILRSFVDDLSEVVGLAPRDAGPRLVDVDFKSTPPGANVEVNNIYVGSTPMSYSLEEDKIYEIRITYPGTLPWEMRVRAYEGLIVNVTLAPAPSTDEGEE